jgi:hypothetical protein
MSCKRKKEHGKKLRRRGRRSFRKTAIDGKVWLFDNSHNSGIVKGRKLHFIN